jgi:mannitol/fructose-specific phosphotransferase system IIA component (Ntr-type)
MSLTEYTDLSRIRFLNSSNKFVAIEELARLYARCPECDNLDELERTLKEREEIMSTGIGFGIAIPHAKIPDIKQISFAVGISKDGIDFDSMDGEPVRLVMLIVASDKQHKEYLGLLSQIMSMLKKTGVKDRIVNSSTAEEVMAVIAEHGA